MFQKTKAASKVMMRAAHIQKKLSRIKKEVAKKEFVAQAGDGLVEATVSGKHEVLALRFTGDSSAISMEQVLDHVREAINQASKRAEKETKLRARAALKGTGFEDSEALVS